MHLGIQHVWLDNVNILQQYILRYVWNKAAIHEPPHDKMSVRPAKTQISLGIYPVWSVLAVALNG